MSTDNTEGRPDLQRYIRDVFLPLGWDDADDGGPEIGLSEGRGDAAHTLYLPMEEYTQTGLHSEGIQLQQSVYRENYLHFT